MGESKLFFAVVTLALLVATVVGCAGPGLTPTPPPAHEITLADARAILDMSSALPTRFQHVDAASEGMSNEDLALGPEFSEVEMFVADEPFQQICAYMTVMKSPIQRAGEDRFIRDEEQVKSTVLDCFEMGFPELSRFVA